MPSTLEDPHAIRDLTFNPLMTFSFRLFRTIFDRNSTNLRGGLGYDHAESWWCVATPPGWAMCGHSQCAPAGQPGPAGFSRPRPPGPHPSPPAAAPRGPERDRDTPAEKSCQSMTALQSGSSLKHLWRSDLTVLFISYLFAEKWRPITV